MAKRASGLLGKQGGGGAKYTSGIKFNKNSKVVGSSNG
jgi:hypothetical protein